MPSGKRGIGFTRPAFAAIVATVLAAGAALCAPFRDVTAESAIPALKHGEGMAVRDLNGDGLPELYLANVRGPDSLMLNLGGGRFRDVSAEWNVTGGETIGPLLADLNGDRRSDLYLVRGAFPKGANLLFLGGPQGFRPDSATSAGVSPPINGIQAFPADFDRDGDLDLFVANWGGDRLYRNDSRGDNVLFTDVAGELGLTSDSRSWSAVWADFDGDGSLDLFVARGDVGGKGGSALYFNRAGKFERAPGRQFDRLWPMGAVATDFDGDGWVDLFLASWDGQAKLFLNDGKGGLADASARSGIAAVAAVGASSGDLDGDLLPDLVVAGYKGGLKAYRNLGRGAFSDLSVDWGFGDVRKNEGVVIADLTGDGRNDVYVASLSGGRFYINEAKTGKSITVRLTGPDARIFGASVRLLEPGGRLLARREISGAHGFCTQGPMEVSIPVDGKTEHLIEAVFSDGRRGKSVAAVSGLVEIGWPEVPGN